MAPFAKGISRFLALSAALAFFVLVPPELLGHGPDLCLWKHVFHITACPACGSTRALAAFFHGHLTQALAYNRNVLITGPLLLVMLAKDSGRAVVNFLVHPRSSHSAATVVHAIQKR